MVSKKAALGLRSNEENIQQQKILARVAIAGIVFFGALSIIVTLGEKKNSNPQTSQILQPIELASQLS